MDTITIGILTFPAALVLFDTILTGQVSNISQRPNVFVDFLLQRRLVLKNRNCLPCERINSGMKSLSVLCVGGRGQPMLAGRSGGGGDGAEKV
jgi:hypothetical protein